MSRCKVRVSREPEGKISLQFEVLQPRGDFFDELHKSVPDLVSHGALQLTQILLQKPEQNGIGSVYNRELLRIGKARLIHYSVVLEIGFLCFSGMVDNRRYMLSQSM